MSESESEDIPLGALGETPSKGKGSSNESVGWTGRKRKAVNYSDTYDKNEFEEEDDDDDDDSSDDEMLDQLASPNKKKAAGKGKAKSKSKGKGKSKSKSKTKSAKKRKAASSSSSSSGGSSPVHGKGGGSLLAHGVPMTGASRLKQLDENKGKFKVDSKNGSPFGPAKDQCVSGILVRWWYVLKWPPSLPAVASSSSATAAAAAALAKVPKENYIEMNGFRGVFIGVEGDDIGKLIDTRRWVPSSFPYSLSIYLSISISIYL